MRGGEKEKGKDVTNATKIRPLNVPKRFRVQISQTSLVMLESWKGHLTMECARILSAL